MLEFIESYFTQNFMGAESNTSYIAGMNFTNLLIAIPIIATILLMYFNCLRSKSAEHAINSVNDCKFISLTLIVYVPTFLIFTNLLGYQLSVCTIFIMILCYIPFVFLSSCTCKEFCLQDGNQKLGGDNNSYAGEFTEKIKCKIQEIRNANKAKNILINGSWGAGKSHFIEKHLISTQSLIYISCTDYADTHELISALITKTNNCLFRWLVRLSISRLLAVLGKYELKEFIGVNKVIVFDEFERLFDYNKIDPMHIVSLIQYLNNQKNCICILIANEDYLNNASQFNNVREKLISYIYNYKIPFDEVIAIIQEQYLQDEINYLVEKKAIVETKTIAEYNRKLQILNNLVVSQGVEKIAKIIDLNDSNFDELRATFQYWYQIDNNIRMMKHLYIKINELYQATYQMVHEDDFYKKHFTNKVDELFSCLPTYINTIIIQLYYLYLKNPYFLTIIEKFAGIYHDDTFAKTDKNNTGENIRSIYFRENSLQQLAAAYIGRKDDQKYSDFIPCIKEILSNEVFANINQELVTEYFKKPNFILSFLNEGEIVPYGMRQNLEFFVRKFKETVCESDDSKLLINYFRRVNVLEERFLQLLNDVKLPWSYNIVADYIAYCQYIKEVREKLGKNELILNPYGKVAYANALIIQMILDSKETNIEQIISEINDSDKLNKLPTILYKRTCLEIIRQSKTFELIKLVKEIADKIDGCKYQLDVRLEFIRLSYSEIQRVTILHEGGFNKENCIKYIDLVKEMTDDLMERKYDPIKALDFMYYLYNSLMERINNKAVNYEEMLIIYKERLISLLSQNNSTEKFLLELFMRLANFNDNDILFEFPNSLLETLVAKIKEVFNTKQRCQEFISKYGEYKSTLFHMVIDKLQEDLDKQNNQETE